MDLSFSASNSGGAIDNLELPHFPAPDSLPELSNLHQINSEFVCEVCQKRCVSRENLRNHRRHVHPKKCFTCPQCLKIFKSTSSLRRHSVIHSSITPRSTISDNVVRHDFACDKCSRGFKSQSALNGHVNRFHAGANIIRTISPAMSSPASVSSQSLLEDSDFSSNLPVFPGGFDDLELQPVDLSSKSKSAKQLQLSSSTAFLSPPSSTSPNSQGNFQQQRPLAILNPDGTVACGQCGKCFQSKSLLSYHRRNVHPSVLHSCEECGKAFKSKSHLRRHGRVHSGERPYACGLCPRRYSDVRHVREHQLRFHGLAACDFVSANISQDHQALNSQISQPTIENHCLTCNTQWPSLAKLRRHVIRHHVTLRSRTTTCQYPYNYRCLLCRNHATRFIYRPPKSLGWHLRYHDKASSNRKVAAAIF